MQITKVSNGYLVELRGNNNNCSVGKRYVATDEVALGKLIQQLAEQLEK